MSRSVPEKRSRRIPPFFTVLLCSSLLLGVILHAVGRREEGISELRVAVKLNPDSQAKEDLKKLK